MPRATANQSSRHAEVEQWIRMARAYAAEQLPFFSPALFAARLVLSEKCPSLAGIDDGMRIYFNPGMVAELLEGQSKKQGLSQLAWIWLHEISHVLRDHGRRCRERCAKVSLWNIAADLEINDADWKPLVAPEKFPPLRPNQFGLPSGRLAEFYYEQLSQLVVSLQLEPAHRPQDEGSGVHGTRRPWELSDSDEQSPAVSSLEQETVRQNVAQSLRKAQGTEAGGWIRWAEQVLKPQINWRELLRRRVRGAIVSGIGGRVDYTYQRPHRRSQAYAPLIRPVLGGDVTPRVTCVVDTSGSISAQELSRLLAEVRGTLTSLRTPITVIPCDDVAYEPVVILTDSDFLKLKGRMQGGGGTNMVAGIEAALEDRPRPDTIIVLTDGWTPYPPRPYRTPVVFGILNPRDFADVPKPPIPPWKDQDVVVIRQDW